MEIDSFDSLKQAADAAFKSKDFAQAVSLYTDCINLKPRAGNIHSNRSACYSSLQQFEQALKDAELAISFGFEKGHFRKAVALHGLKQWENALAAIAKIPSSSALAPELGPISRQIISSAVQQNNSIVFPAAKFLKSVMASLVGCHGLDEEQVHVWTALCNILRSDFTKNQADKVEQHSASKFKYVMEFAFASNCQGLNLIVQQLKSRISAASAASSFQSWAQPIITIIDCVDFVFLSIGQYDKAEAFLRHSYNLLSYNVVILELIDCMNQIAALMSKKQLWEKFSPEAESSFVQLATSLLYAVSHMNLTDMLSCHDFWVKSTSMQSMMLSRFHLLFENETSKKALFNAYVLWVAHITSAAHDLLPGSLRFMTVGIADLLQHGCSSSPLKKRRVFTYFGEQMRQYATKVPSAYNLIWEKIASHALEVIAWTQEKEREDDGFYRNINIEFKTFAKPRRGHDLIPLETGVTMASVIVRHLVENISVRSAMDESTLPRIKSEFFPAVLKGFRYWTGNMQLLLVMRNLISENYERKMPQLDFGPGIASDPKFAAEIRATIKSRMSGAFWGITRDVLTRCLGPEESMVSVAITELKTVLSSRSFFTKDTTPLLYVDSYIRIFFYLFNLKLMSDAASLTGGRGFIADNKNAVDEENVRAHLTTDMALELIDVLHVALKEIINGSLPLAETATRQHVAEFTMTLLCFIAQKHCDDLAGSIVLKKMNTLGFVQLIASSLKKLNLLPMPMPIALPASIVGETLMKAAKAAQINAAAVAAAVVASASQ